MSATVIILGMTVVILVYVLYVYFIKKSNTITTTANLLTGANKPFATLNSGQSTRYAYGIWVFVNTWDTTSQKTIFSRDGNIKVYLDQTKPDLYCNIVQDPDGGQKPILITDNFPIQKWVCIVISSDDRIVDCYLDGKLVNSTKLINSPKTPLKPTEAPVVLGSGWDANVAKFANWSGPLGPQEAWDNYMNGNGSTSTFLSSYNVNLSILKDNVEQSQYKLF